MADLGLVTLGAGSEGVVSGQLYLSRVLATEDGTVTDIKGWVRADNASYSSFIFCIYAGDPTGSYPVGPPLGQSEAFYEPPDTVARKTGVLIEPVEITAGEYYWIGAQGAHDTTAVYYHTIGGEKVFYGAAGSFGTLPTLTSSTPTSEEGYYYSFSATYETSGSSHYISSITNPLLLGGSGTVNTSGMGALTAFTISGKAVSGLTGGAGSSTFNIPAWSDGVQGFKLGAGQTAYASDGTLDTTDTSVTIGPEDTHDYVEIESVNTSAGYLGSYITLNVGDQVKYLVPSELGVTTNYIDVDGGIYTDYSGTQQIHVRNNSTGIVTLVNLITGESAAVAVIVGKQLGVTLGTVTARGSASKIIAGQQSSVSLGIVAARAGSAQAITGKQLGVSLGFVYATGGGGSSGTPQSVKSGNLTTAIGIGIGI